jgi:hypothetical protein
VYRPSIDVKVVDNIPKVLGRAAVLFSKITNVAGMLPKIFAHSLKVIGSGLAFTALSLSFIALRLKFSGRSHFFRGRATQGIGKALKVA